MLNLPLKPHFWQTLVTCCPFQFSLFVSVFIVSFKVRKPKSPAVNEESRITNFELLIIVSLSNASSVIKIDIVKPIPAKSPTPKMDFQFRSVGSLQSPNVTAKKVKTKIPNGLPTISPSAMPKLLFSVKV